MTAWQDSFAQACAEGDADRARRLAHDLVGIARTVGAQALADTATQLQPTVGANEAGCTFDAAALARVHQALTPVIAALTLRNRRV
jgi:HPt (histidine-containing phosphotransfer) domain-containing protein